MIFNKLKALAYCAVLRHFTFVYCLYSPTQGWSTHNSTVTRDSFLVLYGVLYRSERASSHDIGCYNGNERLFREQLVSSKQTTLLRVKTIFCTTGFPQENTSFLKKTNHISKCKLLCHK